MKFMELNKLIMILVTISTSSLLHSASDNMKQLNDMDLNQNGEITFEEFNLSMLNRFKFMDANNDGTITEEEFIAPIKIRFDGFDLNSDGVLKKKEIRKAIRKMKRNEKSNEFSEKKKPKLFLKQ